MNPTAPEIDDDIINGNGSVDQPVPPLSPSFTKGIFSSLEY
jgi:hypothetical protein